MKQPIYLDNHATTPVDPRVRDAMLPWLGPRFGNAGSKTHPFGWAAGEAVEVARGQVAAMIGASPEEIVFTSGSTEGCNIAIQGVATLSERQGVAALSERQGVAALSERQGTAAPSAAEAAHGPSRRLRIVTAATEHHAVLDTCEAVAQAHAHGRGEPSFEVVVLPVDSTGRVDVSEVERAIDGQSHARAGAGADAAVNANANADTHPDAAPAEDRCTLLISLMAANNEVGTIHPIAEVGRLVKERGILFHCDAAQAAGRMEIDVEAWGVDLLTLSAHKFYGPQGVGALYVRSRAPRVRLAPLLHGGGQERGLRPGTLNVPGIVGLGAAAAICGARGEAAGEVSRIAAMRDGLESALRRDIPGIRVNGHPVHRLCGNLSVTFDGVEAEALMLAVPRLAVSAGSACASEGTSTSPVLRAIGLTAEQARSTVRFGIGRFTTDAEIEEAASLVIAAVRSLRGAAAPARRSGVERTGA